MQQASPLSTQISAGTSLLQLNHIAAAPVMRDPYPYLVAHNVLSKDLLTRLYADFPAIEKPGFFPVGTMARKGAFDTLIKELQSPELAELLTQKLQIELRDKPSMVTVRKWSAAKDGRIHNDGEAKIVTSLLYLNEGWPEGEDGGKFRVLRSDRSFDDSAAEIAPLFGTFIAFARTENSWHGHKPFVGERRVIQTTWLRSHEDLERKQKRGRLSLLLKNWLSFSKNGI